MKIIPQYNREMLTKYDMLLPRYTSYPTALQFSEGITENDWHHAWRTVGADTDLSLYFHIPYCRSPCFYCACSRIITRDTNRSTPYLDAIIKEMEVASARVPEAHRKVSQVHLGGGTPTFLAQDQLTMLWQAIERHFTLDPEGEYSIEVDPRAADISMIKHLAELGFNRMSFGVQDLDKDVQQAINRVQSAEDTFSQIQAARHAGIQSINLDLIYGLPKQTVQTFSYTIDRVLEARPERIAVYGYAHMPSVFKAQRQIAKYDLPDLSNKLRLLEVAIEKFQNAGYEYIGLDHFSLPEDELAMARKSGTLHRNFQGYSTQKDLNMLGFGVTSIGKIGNTYFQNNKLEDEYMALVSGGNMPLFKGYVMNDDDLIRKDVIMSLMCQGRVDFSEFLQKNRIPFIQYFQSGLPELGNLEKDGLIEISGDALVVKPVGQLLLRNIANIFDAYRTPHSPQQIPLKVAL